MERVQRGQRVFRILIPFWAFRVQRDFSSFWHERLFWAFGDFRGYRPFGRLRLVWEVWVFGALGLQRIFWDVLGGQRDFRVLWQVHYWGQRDQRLQRNILWMERDFGYVWVFRGLQRSERVFGDGGVFRDFWVQGGFRDVGVFGGLQRSERIFWPFGDVGEVRDGRRSRVLRP